MYAQLRESFSVLPGSARLSRRGLLGSGVSRNVVSLGFTSLFTDISSESVSAILPLYLVFFLRLSPLEFGLIDGLYQGAGALLRLVGGLAADRWQRYKEVAGLGYLLSALSKVGLLVFGGAWGLLAATVLVDRAGKGIRTSPRDALISLSTRREDLGLAFGVHRALDTFGALVGPLLAFGLLAVVPNGFDVVFVASLCAAVVGLGVLGLFVENRPPVRVARRQVTLRDALGVVRAARFRAVSLAGVALALATISDGFVYLGLQQRLSFAAGFIPLLYVATSAVYLLLAVPIGRLADRVGRGRVFLGGYALLIGVYAIVLFPSIGEVGLAVCLLLFGTYYAATDGVLMALTSEDVPADLRTTGMSVLTTGTGAARLLGSVAFGALWTWQGLEVATSVFLLALVVALIGAGWMLARRATMRSEVAEYAPAIAPS